MSESKLSKCSRCHSNILQDKFFSKNRKGDWLKTCNKCRLRHKCDSCNYKCVSRGDLKKHKKAVHDKIKNVACDICDYKCSLNCNLNQHKKQVHDKIKNFACDIDDCNFKSSTNSGLIQHKKIVHYKIKNSACDIDDCKYKCSSNSDLKKHKKRVHYKIKNFACDNCNFKSSTNSHLTRHKKICTGSLNISAGELACRNALTAMNIRYKTEVSKVKNNDGNWTRFDFELSIDDKALYIEYDGNQHTKPISCWGGEKAFKKLQESDLLKNNWCKDNNKPLLRIPHTKFGSIPQLITDFVCENTEWSG